MLSSDADTNTGILTFNTVDTRTKVSFRVAREGLVFSYAEGSFYTRESDSKNWWQDFGSEFHVHAVNGLSLRSNSPQRYVYRQTGAAPPHAADIEVYLHEEGTWRSIRFDEFDDPCNW